MNPSTVVHLAPCLTNHAHPPSPPPLPTGFAGAVASTITCPIEVIKTQLQSSRVGGGSNPVQVAKEIWAAEGTCIRMHTLDCQRSYPVL